MGGANNITYLLDWIKKQKQTKLTQTQTLLKSINFCLFPPLSEAFVWRPKNKTRNRVLCKFGTTRSLRQVPFDELQVYVFTKPKCCHSILGS